MNHWHRHNIAATTLTRSRSQRLKIIEWVLVHGIVTGSGLVGEARVEPGVLRKSETSQRSRILRLMEAVAEVPKNVVQYPIGIIAAAAATAAAAIACTFAAVAVAAELHWRRNQIQARYLPVVHSLVRDTIVVGLVGPGQGRVVQI
jgi:ribonuclease PH